MRWDRQQRPQELRQLFLYDPITGILQWRERFGKDGWNRRYANKAIQTLDRHGYIQVRLKPLNMRAHRVIWAMMTGAWPSEDIDHINGVRNDNHWENLREASRSLNNHNRHTPRRSSYPKGVTLHKASGLYRAYVNLEGKQHSLGYFKTEAEAVSAYADKAPALLGEFYKEPQYA